MATTTEELLVSVVVDGKGAINSLKATGKAFKTVDTATKTTKKNTNKLSESFKRLRDVSVTLNQGFELIGKAGRAMQKTFDATITSAAALGKSVAEVTTLLDDSAGITEKLKDQVLGLQIQFGGDQANIAGAFYQAISSGAVDATTAVDLLTKANELAIGGVTDLKTATDGITSAMKGFGIGIDEISRITDNLFIGMKKGKTTVGELSGNLGMLAGTAQSAGVTFEEVVSGMSALTLKGISTSMATTQLRSVIVGLSKQSTELADVLNKKLNISNIKTAISARGFLQVLKDIVAQTDGTSEGLFKLFGRNEAVEGIMSLIAGETGKGYIETLAAMKKAAEEQGEVTKEAFEKMAGTADRQFEVIKGASTAALTSIGNAILVVVLPALISFAKKMQEVATDIIEFARKIKNIDWNDLKQSAENATIAVAGLGLAFAAFKFASIAIALKSVGDAFVYIGLAAKGALASIAPLLIAFAKFAAIAAIVVGVVATVDILRRNIDKLGQLWATVWSAMITSVKTGYKWMLQFSKGVLDLLGVENDLESKIKAVNSEIDKSSEKTSKLAEGLDFGPLGKLLETMADSTEKVAENTEKVGKAAEENNKKGKGAIEQTKEQIELMKKQAQILEGLTMENKQLELDIKNFGLSQEKTITENLRFEKDLLNLKMDKLEQEKLINSEIEEQIMLQKALLDKSAILEMTKIAEERIEALKIDLGDTTSEEVKIKNLTNELKFVNAEIERMQKITGPKLDEEYKLLKKQQERAEALKRQIAQLKKDMAGTFGLPDREKPTYESARFFSDEEQAGLEEVVYNFQKVFDKGAKGFSHVIDKVADFFTPSKEWSNILGHFGASVPGPQEEEPIAANVLKDQSKAFISGIGRAFNKVDTFVTVIQALIDLIPQFIDKLTKVFNSLTELPQRLVKSFLNLSKALKKFVKEFIPELLKAIPIIVQIFADLFTQLPGIFDEMIMSLPKIFEEFIEKFIEVIPQFVVGFITGLPRIVATLVRGIMRVIPVLIKELINAVPELANEILNALIQAFNYLGKLIEATVMGRDLPKMEDFFDFKKVEENIKKSATLSLTGLSEEQFKVMDANANATGANLAEDIRNAIDSSTTRTRNALQFMWDKLVEAWRHIWNTILEPFGKYIGMWLTKGLAEIGKVISKLGELLGKGAKWLLDAIIKMFDWLVDAGAFVVEFVKSFAKAAGDFLAVIGEGILNIGKELGKGIETILMDLGGIFMKGVDGLAGAGEKLFGWLDLGGLSLSNNMALGSEGVGLSADKLKDKLTEGSDLVKEGAQGLFDKLSEGADKIAEKIGAAGAKLSEFGGKISEGFNNALDALGLGDWFSDLGKNISNAFNLGLDALGLSDWFSGLGRKIADAFDLGLSINNIASWFKGLGGFIADGFSDAVSGFGGNFVDKVKGALGLHRGGPINAAPMAPKWAYASLPAFQTGGAIDDRLIRAQRGEFMMSRLGRETLGDTILNAANRGQNIASGGSVVNNINLTVNTSRPITDDFIKTRIVPVIDKSIMRKSLDGRKIIDKRGLR